MKKTELIRLNLGAGVRAFKGWINVDKYISEKEMKEHKGMFANAVFEKGAKWVQADICKLPFPDDYADWVEAHEVLEHIPYYDVVTALKEIYRVMKKGATFIMNTPSFDGLCLDYLKLSLERQFDQDKYLNVMQTIVGNQIGEGETHKCIFNLEFLNACLVTAGFIKGEIRIYYKNNAYPKVGYLGRLPKGHVLRNDVLVATMTK